MPEGPEVRTLVDQLQGGVGRRLIDLKFVSGRYTHQRPPDGFRAFAETMSKWESNEVPAKAVDIIQEWTCKGKFLYVLLDAGAGIHSDPDFQRSLWITLGMTGRFVSESVQNEDSRHTRWYLELVDIKSGETNRIYYQDMRNFGTLKFSLSREALNEKLQSLGPDLLRADTTEDDFVNIVSAQRPQTNVCKFLMNQSKIAGIGNYILAEGLYRAGIDPFASLNELDEVQQRMLFRELRATALESYEAQGMTKEKGGQYRTMDGERGKFEFQLQCYGRSLCARGRTVRNARGPHGRTIWYTDEQLFMPRHERVGVSANGSLQKLNSPEEISVRSTASGKGRTGDAEIAPEVATVEDVSEFLSVLTEPSWKKILSDATKSDSFRRLVAFLQSEREAGATIYPPTEDIFSALNLTPFEDVKVVIVGQDPYHGHGQGHGLAFSVRAGVKAPPSLQNIIREVTDDVGIQAPKHGNLEHWSKQGVLLLNAVLTVRSGEANSHSKKGWEEFTDSIIQKLNDEREGLVFLLWGNPAAKKASRVDESRHTIIRTSHPSPLGATKTSSPFLGSKCFSHVNKVLVKTGGQPIDWSIS